MKPALKIRYSHSVLAENRYLQKMVTHVPLMVMIINLGSFECYLKRHRTALPLALKVARNQSSSLAVPLNTPFPSPPFGAFPKTTNHVRHTPEADLPYSSA